MANTIAIKQRMRNEKLTVQQVSTALSMDQSTFHRKLSKNGTTFTLEQAEILACMLKLTPQEAQSIFFDRELA